MKAEEKAKELVNGMCCEIGTYNTRLVIKMAKACAVVTALEMLKIEYTVGTTFDETAQFVRYWQEVKSEIEKL